MYVCLCNAVRERQIANAVSQGCRSVGEVHRSLGTRPQCGKCTCDIAQMIRNRNDSEKMPALIAAE